MHRLPDYHRLILLTDSRLGIFTSKTAATVLRDRPNDVVAIVDANAAGQSPADHIPWAPSVPIVPDVTAALAHQPDAAVIGVAPIGGGLTPSLRKEIEAALHAGVSVISGLHDFLDDDPHFRGLADESGAHLYDLRRPPPDRRVASSQARNTRARRVLTVGSDCNVGKLATAQALCQEARQRNHAAALAATGQSGILSTGAGTVIDACVADFIAGAAEELVLAHADADYCFIEGQGSLGHPGYSGVTLALLHGTCPEALVLVHQLNRTSYKAPPHLPLPTLPTLIAGYEELAGWLHPAKIVAIGLNTVEYDDAIAADACRDLEAALNLPVADPIRHGPAKLLDAIEFAYPPRN
jgi:uncharacterized NAD-dependent epimerase/dehydratase family protein